MAFESVQFHKNYAYVHLRKVNPDVCVLIADFLMKIHSIDWSIVSGLHFGIQASKENLSHPFDSRGLNVNRKQIQGVKNYGCTQ